MKLPEVASAFKGDRGLADDWTRTETGNDFFNTAKQVYFQETTLLSGSDFIIIDQTNDVR